MYTIVEQSRASIAIIQTNNIQQQKTNYHIDYQVYKHEMRILDRRWCTRAVCAIKI